MEAREPGPIRTPESKRGITNRISSPYQTPNQKDRLHSPKISSDPVKQAVESKERRAAANRKAVERRLALELSECTFKPAISKKSLNIASYARSSWPSLHEPKSVKSQEEMKPVAPEPTIDPYSKILCEQHDRSGPIHDRLMSYGERIRYKKNLLNDQKDLIEQLMSPKKVVSDSKSAKTSKAKTEVGLLNDEYLRGKQFIFTEQVTNRRDSATPSSKETAFAKEDGEKVGCSRQLFEKDVISSATKDSFLVSTARELEGESGFIKELENQNEDDVERLTNRCLQLQSENLSLRLKNKQLESEKQKIQLDLDIVLEKSKAVVLLNARLVKKIKKLTAKSCRPPGSSPHSTPGSANADTDDSSADDDHTAAGAVTARDNRKVSGWDSRGDDAFLAFLAETDLAKRRAGENPERSDGNPVPAALLPEGRYVDEMREVASAGRSGDVTKGSHSLLGCIGTSDSESVADSRHGSDGDKAAETRSSDASRRRHNLMEPRSTSGSEDSLLAMEVGAQV